LIRLSGLRELAQQNLLSVLVQDLAISVTSTCCHAISLANPAAAVSAFGLLLLLYVDDQRYVYVLVSTVHEGRYYTGLTSDVQARLAAHNAGLSTHTANSRPWKVVTTIEFADAERARVFESYLKSGSGRAFAQRYFR
jgi:predicted GIY-YIG superfamily endonuclease